MLLFCGNFGMLPSAADKRKAMTRLLADAEWSAWSDREIARQCEVGHPFVAKHRKELSLESNSSEESPSPPTGGLHHCGLTATGLRCAGPVAAGAVGRLLPGMAGRTGSRCHRRIRG